MKGKLSPPVRALLFPAAGLRAAGLQSLAALERRSSHGIPPLCPPRQVGLRAARQHSWLGNGYLWATGKVSHLRITHSQRVCVKKECRQRETQWLSFHALQIMSAKVCFG
ncbi:hypothetical protein CgunFtcFv8_006491 [Champsocephalus gunnari]|uniref:Uncharacterized protein n=1 Tax=Champsocephalus gunnari TaxID=52237 RepID=A0AAN8BYD1_CHAGU|nr:hypothetical protein CgunFtcFv8_006491 [Champsocephalus gunnari]